ncbi:MAG: methyltransferase domain-containing protein [Chloroflexia bacterium]
MDTLHKHEQGHTQDHGHEHKQHPQHGHGHAHPHKQTEPPPTEGLLIRQARFYDLRVGLMLLGTTRLLRSLPLDLAVLQPGERVLDVGCGTGGLAMGAARQVGPTGTVWGIDAAPEMIAEARRKAQRSGHAVQFQVQPVEAMSFPNDSFDVVFSSLMMHHLPVDLRRRALAEIRRVLRPGGRIVIIDLQPISRPLRPWEPGWLLTRLHKLHTHPEAGVRANGAPLSNLLREAGFTDIDNGPTRYPWIGYARGTNTL